MTKFVNITAFISLLTGLFLSSPKPSRAILKDVYTMKAEKEQKVKLKPDKPITFKINSPVESFSAVALKFTKPRNSTDWVMFKFKESGADPSAYDEAGWLVEKKVFLDQPDMFVLDGWFHPIGLPEITNAENRNYTIKITNLEKDKEEYTQIITTETGQPAYKLQTETDAKPIIFSDLISKLQSEPLLYLTWTSIILLLIWQILKP